MGIHGLLLLGVELEIPVAGCTTYLHELGLGRGRTRRFRPPDTRHRLDKSKDEKILAMKHISLKISLGHTYVNQKLRLHTTTVLISRLSHGAPDRTYGYFGLILKPNELLMNNLSAGQSYAKFPNIRRLFFILYRKIIL